MDRFGAQHLLQRDKPLECADGWGNQVHLPGFLRGRATLQFGSRPDGIEQPGG